MICHNCMKELSENAEQCSYCGKTIVAGLATVENTKAAAVSGLSISAISRPISSKDESHDEISQLEVEETIATSSIKSPPDSVRRQWKPLTDKVSAWAITKELNHYEVLELDENDSNEEVNARIKILDDMLEDWAADPEKELQSIGSRGKNRLPEMRQAFRDRSKYNLVVKQEKHGTAIKRVHEVIEQCLKDEVLQWNEWKFTILPKAEEEGVSREEVESLLREYRNRGFLTGLIIADREVRTILELKDVCEGKGDQLVPVIWNGQLEKWLEKAATRKDLANEVQLIKEQYANNKLSGAQRILWKTNERTLVLTGKKGEEKISSIKEWVEGVYSHGLEDSSIEALQDRRLENWIGIALNRERLSRVASEEREHGQKGLWELIWQTGERSSLKEDAYLVTKKLAQQFPDWGEAHYQHAIHCDDTKRLDELKQHIQAAFKSSPHYAALAISDGSFRNYRKEVQDLAKPINASSKPFKFKGAQAFTIADLVTLCDDYPEEAQEFLFNESLIRWLETEQYEAALALEARTIAKAYTKQKRNGLELFVRELCKEIGADPYPQLSVQPNHINLGVLPVGAQAAVSIRLKKNGRGHAWGAINIEPHLPGISCASSFDNPNAAIDINLDTLHLVAKKYEGKIVIKGEGLPSVIEVPLRYEVTPLNVNFDPPVLNLGKIMYGMKHGAILRITTTPEGGRIAGAPRGLDPKIDGAMTTGRLNGPSGHLELNIDTSRLQPGKRYKTNLVLETNVGKLQVPVDFKTSLRWKHVVAGRTIAYSLATGAAMYILRALLQSFDKLNQWFLSYESDPTIIIVTGAFGALAVLSMAIVFRNSKPVKALASIPNRFLNIFKRKKFSNDRQAY